MIERIFLDTPFGPNARLVRFDDGLTSVSFFHTEGYLVYQVHATHPTFQSPHFKLFEFTATNGVRICSKNSPLFVSPESIFLRGAFREFDAKPSVYYLPDVTQFEAVTTKLVEALKEFSVAVVQPDFKPRVVEARDGIEDQ